MMIWREGELFYVWHGVFSNQIRKCRHAEFFRNPVVNVFEGVDPQFLAGLDDGKECVFCFGTGMSIHILSLAEKTSQRRTRRIIQCVLRWKTGLFLRVAEDFQMIDCGRDRQNPVEKVFLKTENGILPRKIRLLP